MRRLRMYIETMGLLGACGVRALVSGRSDTVPKNIRRVAIVQTAKMGDMVCTTPLFRAVKNAFPHVEVVVVGDSINEEVVKYNPDVSGYVVWRNNPRMLAKELAALRIDFACITTPNFQALAALYLSGIPCIVAPKVFGGWSPFETRAYKLVHAFVLSKPHTMGQYAPREYLRLLEPLGVFCEDTTKHLAYSPEAEKEVAAYLAEYGLAGKRFAVISPSVGNKIKNWPAERFAQVAEHLVAKSVPVVVIGGPRDTEEVRETFAKILAPNPHIINGSGRFSVDALKALISASTLFVSVDTGPLYIAEAFGVPTVDIVGPMDEHEQPPIGPRHVVVVAPGRGSAQLHILNARIYDEEEARRQTEAITTQAVIDAVESVLQT